MITCNGNPTEWKTFNDIIDWANRNKKVYIELDDKTLEVFDVVSLSFVEGKEVYGEPHTCRYVKND